MTGPGDVPPEILDRLRPICPGLPETYEEPAWVGIRWRIRKRTFAHAYEWPADVVGLVLDGGVDWDEVAELLAESYCVLAPTRLAALVSREGL